MDNEMSEKTEDNDASGDVLKDLDELEGIVNNEPPKNKYETVKFHKLNSFPYFLIGKVVSKFDFDGVNKFLNGVGMLIGPDIVLTVAHNLCHLVPSPSKEPKILLTKKVCFFSAANGDFNLFEPVKSVRTYIPDEYINALKTDNKENQLYNDWGMIFLSAPVGDSITTLLDIEKTNYLKVNGSLYSFFTNNENINLAKLSKQTKSEKVSIIGYTEYKENYKNNSAYKFLGNFRKSTNVQDGNKQNLNLTKSDCISEAHIANFNAHQGKIISEIVKEGKDFLNKDNKININININTSDTENVTEGLITSSRFYHQKINGDGNRVALNGLDYIVLGNEEYNKDFDITDVDKLIMSESKGNLIGNQEHDWNAIRYQISTYKGQSGSPIFLRIKKMTDRMEVSKTKQGYIYQFVGLHSRRGPTVGDKQFYESDKMNTLTENLLTGEVPENSVRNNVKTKYAKEEEQQVDKESDSMVKYTKNNNDIIKQNGICEYNMALSIMGETIKIVKDCVAKQSIAEDTSTATCRPLRSEFVLTKIFLNDTIKMSGLFKKNIPLSVLFSFGAKIFNVPKEYILLKDIANPDGLSIQNYNYDQNKKLCEIMEDPDNSSSMSFELMLNFKKYGEFMSNNILQKFLENYDLEESQLKKDFKKYIKALFHSIFSEINSFDNIHPTYGKLFKKIRKTILTKLGLNEAKP